MSDWSVVQVWGSCPMNDGVVPQPYFFWPNQGIFLEGWYYSRETLIEFLALFVYLDTLKAYEAINCTATPFKFTDS